MQLTISGQHLDLTDSMKNYIGEKMQRIERHFDHLNSIDVVLTVENIHHKAEATINAKGVRLHAHADSDNMYATIDTLTDKLDSQVRKHKEKTTDHHKSDGALKKQVFDPIDEQHTFGNGTAGNLCEWSTTQNSMTNQSQLCGVLAPERVHLNAAISSKKKLLEEMATLLASNPALELKPKEVFQLLLEREKVGNTGIGEGIAMPHSRCAKVPEAIMAVISLAEEIDYDSIDKQPVRLAFGLLVPQDANEQHLTLLSNIAKIMRVSGRLKAITELGQTKDLLSCIELWETQS